MPRSSSDEGISRTPSRGSLVGVAGPRLGDALEAARSTSSRASPSPGSRAAGSGAGTYQSVRRSSHSR